MLFSFVMFEFLEEVLQTWFSNLQVMFWLLPTAFSLLLTDLYHPKDLQQS